ncbi:hypothetical protein [Cohnella sp. REN36]|uniref:hypothetical protein n=1 Tax=Cohnella sp. REN36 TaxID=2887347 RepID=UPI001D15CAB0|nr:hypothetical protein [Cohnella sp. REN36]MCC3371785.1 hypothetical protein [Cohnella sp. REN36]
MSSSIMDLNLTSVRDQTVYLTKGVLQNDDQQLTSLAPGQKIVLQHGRLRQEATIQFRAAGECFIGMFEMNAALAKKMRLLDYKRYRLVHDPNNDVVRIDAAPVSVASGMHRHSPRLRGQTISIGYQLQSQLGIPDIRGYAVTVKSGDAVRKMFVGTPSNLFDHEMQTAPGTGKALRLAPGKSYGLRYDQRTRTLTILGPTGRA